MKYLLSCLAILAAVSFARADEKSDLLLLGKDAYMQHCARCHGNEGKGNGYDAKRVPVTPRDFTRGTYKFRTTASGTPPTDADLLYVLNHGLSGSGMPSFGNLDINTKKALIEYVKSLSSAFNEYPPQPLAEPNVKAKVDQKRGKEIYEKLQCGLCHGAEGRANGTSAPTLVDSWGAPIKAANLNQEWTYRAGASARDVYFRLMSGIAGTPMPSYDGAITTDEAWQLANYVVSLQQHANWAYNIVTGKTAEPLPATVDDAAWRKAPRTDVNVQSQYYANGRKHEGTIRSVAVQVLVNGNDAALRLSWNDPTKDNSDRVSVAFTAPGFDISKRETLATMDIENSKQFTAVNWMASTAKPSAVYNDGLWSVVLNAKIDPERKDTLIGFAAWDGRSNESGMKRSVSQWIPLYIGENPHAVHH